MAWIDQFLGLPTTEYGTPLSKLCPWLNEAEAHLMEPFQGFVVRKLVTVATTVAGARNYLLGLRTQTGQGEDHYLTQEKAESTLLSVSASCARQAQERRLGMLTHLRQSDRCATLYLLRWVVAGEGGLPVYAQAYTGPAAERELFNQLAKEEEPCLSQS